jgi:hypothetical protein
MENLKGNLFSKLQSEREEGKIEKKFADLKFITQ